MASVPIVTPLGHLVGVLNVHTRLRREFTAADVELLRSVAGLVAGAIENARLHRRLAEREEALEQFAERMVEWQEHERRRLAGEIHDGISQRIVSLFFHLSAAADAHPRRPEAAAEQVALAQELAAAAAGRDPVRDRRAAPAGARRPRAGRQPGKPGPLVPAAGRAGRGHAAAGWPSTSRPPCTAPRRRRCRTRPSMRAPATVRVRLYLAAGRDRAGGRPTTAPGSTRPPSAPTAGRPPPQERPWRASRPASASRPCGSAPSCWAEGWSWPPRRGGGPRSG